MIKHKEYFQSKKIATFFKRQFLLLQIIPCQTYTLYIYFFEIDFSLGYTIIDEVILLQFTRKKMKKELKIVLWCVLAIILIVLLFVFLWTGKNKVWEPNETETEILTWEETQIPDETQQDQKNSNSEQDILNDLSAFFSNSNWYEDIEWEFWFIGWDNE